MARNSMLRKLGWIDKLFLAFLALYLVSALFNPAGASRTFLGFLAIVTGFITGFRLIRHGLRRVIWRLRNRLLVVYAFIAVVPVVLILVLAGIAAWAITGQVAIHLVASELERQTKTLRTQAEWLARTSPGERGALIGYLKERFPEIEVQTGTASPSSKDNSSGVILKDQRWYEWGRAIQGAAEVNLLRPLTRQSLAGLVPGLGEVTIFNLTKSPGVETRPRESFVPPAASRFDFEIPWGSLFPVTTWNAPGRFKMTLVGIRSRPSAVLQTIFGQGAEYAQELLWVFVGVAALFLIVELISLVIGASLTRTITLAVHDLYRATQKVKEGDFSHRIEVRGNDQLAELSQSFNLMTGNLKRLVSVEKEKERLQSELEIAREVQNQLYPKSVPKMKSLRLKAACHPARVVSGDYFDYQGLADSTVALAIGDVAGKGISAALLMATVQSSLRTQLRNINRSELSAAALVAQLNQHLFAYTSPEKYATFYFGLYDDSTGALTYTNAGHLPPVILRNGDSIRLDVNGTIVGAFSASKYNESRVQLCAGDLLVCYTDGITEPENEYGEMFGEERLLENVRKNAGRGESEIIDAVIDSVREWTGAGELQDDMTLLIARRM